MARNKRHNPYKEAKWAYGSMKMGKIPAHSTLIFEMELVKIER